MGNQNKHFCLIMHFYLFKKKNTSLAPKGSKCPSVDFPLKVEKRPDCPVQVVNNLIKTMIDSYHVTTKSEI